MLKILETIALVFLKQALNGPHDTKNAPHDANYYTNKGKIIALFCILAITLSILFAGGILLALSGFSVWLNDHSQAAPLYFVYTGCGLSLISAGIVATTLLWKKQAPLQKFQSNPLPNHSAADLQDKTPEN